MVLSCFIWHYVYDKQYKLGQKNWSIKLKRWTWPNTSRTRTTTAKREAILLLFPSNIAYIHNTLTKSELIFGNKNSTQHFNIPMSILVFCTLQFPLWLQILKHEYIFKMFLWIFLIRVTWKPWLFWTYMGYPFMLW